MRQSQELATVESAAAPVADVWEQLTERMNRRHLLDVLDTLAANLITPHRQRTQSAPIMQW
jgi:hypothetical protein